MQNISEEDKIVYEKKVVIDVLKEIEYILCSLHRMGSYYSVNKVERSLYEKETTDFIDKSLVCSRLAKIRRNLSEGFNLVVGEDGMDELEGACENIPYWKKPGDYCDKLWIEEDDV